MVRGVAPKRRRLTGLLALLFVSLVAGGCGSDQRAKTTLADGIRVALILPSASDELAWSHGMYVGVLAAQEQLGEGRMEVTIEEDLPTPSDAAASIDYYAQQGYDLVIAHGPQYRDIVFRIAADFPEVSFAYGTGSRTAGNVFAYEPQAQQGGYLLGMLAGLMTRTNRIGLVGLVEGGDATRYAGGFAQGVSATNAVAEVLPGYTGSYDNTAAAIQLAKTHLESGADILTGTVLRAQGAVQVAEEHAVPWLASDMGSTKAWPEAVMAAQVYSWKDVVIELVEARARGVKGGQHILLTFGNGRLSLSFSDDFAIPEAVKSVIEDAVQAIMDGSLVVE